MHSTNSVGYSTTIFFTDEDGITDSKADDNVYYAADTDRYRNHKNYTLTKYVCSQIVKGRKNHARRFYG